MSASETDSAEDSDDLDDEEDLQDDGLSSSTESEDEEGEEGDDDPLLFESAEETEYLAEEDANDRVAPLAKDHSRQRRASRRTSNGSYDSSTSVSGNVRRPVRQESMNSTSSNDALGPAPARASASGTKTPSSIPQDTTGNTSATNSSADLVRPASGLETSVRIVSPSTAGSSPHPQGYFDTVPPPASVARRRLFKKSSRDDYGPGTPGGLLTPSGMDSGAATPASIGGAAPATRKRRPVFKRGRGKKGTGYTLEHQGHDILGIVMLEIEGAVDLPKLRNCR